MEAEIWLKKTLKILNEWPFIIIIIENLKYDCSSYEFEHEHQASKLSHQLP